MAALNKNVQGIVMNSCKFEWTQEKMDFMRDAFEQVRYQEELAERALHYIFRGISVCDAGCGLGYLALALSGRCREVTALDISRDALDVLRQNLAKRPATGIRIRQEDFLRMPDDEIYDDMIFCFSGSMQEILQTAAAHCRENVILFRKNWPYHRLSRKKIRLSELVFPKDCEMLRDSGIPCLTECFPLDMGQPFRSLEDACRFFRLYQKDEDPGTITEEYAASVLATEGYPAISEEFPYYFPMKREVGMIVIRAEDIRKAFHPENDWITGTRRITIEETHTAHTAAQKSGG